MNKNTNVCNNCGKPGHLFHQCKLPITSYGIILFKPEFEPKPKQELEQEGGGSYKYLMIRRKDSFGFTDFIRGKYSLCNVQQIQNMVNEMSMEEKNMILTSPFEEMWEKTFSLQLKNEEYISKKKFTQIKEGVVYQNTNIQLKDIVENSNTNWNETEWEFPKGRRNPKEKDLECALREFHEETGIFPFKIKIVENILPFEEIFIGTNYKSYKHKYFLACMVEEDDLNGFQTSEVSKIEWKNIDQCLKDIRPYNLEKKKLITNINKVLQEYRLYS
jgi:8-oxo-dGTP pyrophosphatase MutT (NUDIX family)